MGRQVNAGDYDALGAGHLGYRQGGRTCAPCADHKHRPVREDEFTHHPFHQYTVDHHQEADTSAYEDLGSGRQAAGSYSSAAASSASGRHW